MPIFNEFLSHNNNFQLHACCMYVYLKVLRSIVFVIGPGLRHDPHQLQGGAVFAVYCSSYCNTVMDTLWRGCVVKQASQEQWSGCRMGYWKQESAQGTGD